MELKVEPGEENDNREMETIPEQIPLVEEEDMPFKMSPMSPPGPEMREDFPKLAESSRKDAGNNEIMEMLRSIKKYMEEREQKWEKQQQIKEEFLEAEFRRKEQLLEQTLRLREEEWREWMKRREKEFGEKMEASLEAFYNNQFIRDEEVLTMLKKKKLKWRVICLKKIEAFKYLYIEQFKEFGKFIKDRDKELEDNDVYRIKICHESLDLNNKNLSNMLSYISELESKVNKMGLKQDTLINLVNLKNDLISTDKAEPTPSEKKRPNMTFSKFSPCLASFYLDPPNIIPKKSDKRRK